jgi:DNA-directed RNA polymerase specialized sigma24 family protein
MDATLTLHLALDPRLALAAGRGDADAVAELARRCRPILLAQARSVLGRAARREPSDALEELVAEVEAFLAAGAPGDDGPGWSRFDPAQSGGGVEGWLYGIVRNKALRRLRDARRRRAAARRDAFAGPAVWEALRIERALDAERALDLAEGLPSRERSALALWLAGASSREIARRLRFASPHAVDCCLARTKARLRGLMLGAEAIAAA